MHAWSSSSIHQLTQISLDLCLFLTPTLSLVHSLIIHLFTHADIWAHKCTISHLFADCFSISPSSQSWVHGEYELTCLGILNIIFQWCLRRKTLADRFLFFPMEGHRCCRTWNKRGRDVEWNGWWQYLNANENEVGFGEMLNVLYSRVVIWNQKLLSHVPVAARFPLHEGAGNKIKALFLCQLQLNKVDRIYIRSIWSNADVHTVENCVFYSFTLQYKDWKLQFILLSPIGVLSPQDSTEITNLCAL